MLSVALMFSPAVEGDEQEREEQANWATGMSLLTARMLKL